MTHKTLFFVYGNPAPQGSKKHVGRGIMIESCKRLKAWRESIAEAAKRENITPTEGPVRLDIQFFLPRPNAHYRTGKNYNILKQAAPKNHLQKPDLDKLVRAVGDALTGIAYHDDSQIHVGTFRKRWATRGNAGAIIEIIRIDEPEDDPGNEKAAS